MAVLPGMKPLLIAVLVCLVLAACGSDSDSGGEAVSPTVPSSPGATPTPDAASGPDPTPSRSEPNEPTLLISSVARNESPSPAGVPATVAGSNDFGFDLYRVATAADAENFVFSPVSAAQAFALVRAGATDTTAEQLDTVFGYPADVHEANNALDQSLTEANLEPRFEGDPEVVLEVANSAWGQVGFPIEEAYLDTLARNYGAGLQQVDFLNDGEGAKDAINGWADEKTRGRIPEPLLEPLSRDTVLALVNAIYLKASWLNPFTEELTTDRPFTSADGTTTDVPTMVGQSWMPHVVTDAYEAVALPYAGGQLSMVLVEPTDLVSFEQQLDSVGLDGLLAEMDAGEVELELPKWDFETRTELLDPLAQLGLTELRDLDGIAPNTEIGEAFQVANITVDEAGTEAAAVTVVAVEVTSAPVEPPVVTPIAFDNPFVFVIRHDPTGTILFLGRIMNPTV